MGLDALTVHRRSDKMDTIPLRVEGADDYDGLERLKVGSTHMGSRTMGECMASSFIGRTAVFQAAE